MSATVATASGPDASLVRFLHGFDEFLYFPSIRWSYSWQRQQEVVVAFAAAHGDRAGWIFPPLGLLAHSPLRWDTWAALGGAVGARVAAVRPPAPAGGRYQLPSNLKPVRGAFVPGAGAWRRDVTLATSRTFRALLRKRGRRLILTTYMNDLVEAFCDGADYVVLDLSERRQASPTLPTHVKELERAAARRVHALVADSRATLADYAAERASLGRPGHYVPQGFTPGGPVPELAVAADAPLAYLGNLHHALDVEWLLALAGANRERKLRVCGEVRNERARALLAQPNVEYWGAIAHAEIPRFLNGVAWGLVPYRLDAWTAGVFPTKLFEYLARGVPVLSTALPEVAQFAGYPFVQIFPDAAAPLPRRSVAGVESFLADHTWSARMRSYGEFLEATP